jgi:serine/threonine-protein kinase Chk2
MSPTIAPVQNPELTAGVGEKPSKGEEQDSKKPRRSERISSQPQTTPLDQKTHLPSPLTHREHTDFDDHHEATASPPDGRPSQIRHRTPTSNSSPPHPGLSSPPNDTQAYSQFVCPPIPLSHEVKDEEAEGVWGYLVPIDSVFGDTLVMRKRVSCPAPFPEGGFGRGSTKRAQGICPGKSYVQEELNYEANKRALGFPAGGYLIGRHPECGQMLLQREVFHRRYADQWADRVLALPTISNRHCIIFNENKDGKSVAILEDLSTNGTFVNEAIVGRNKRRELDHADQISVLDQARFMFYYPSNRERNAFRQQYRILHQLGKGHFATVHLCVERCTGMQFAVKKFEKRPGDDRSRTEGLQQEIGVLKSVSHPNMLCLKDCFDEDDGVYVVLELAPEGELFNYIVMKQKLTEEQARKVFVQLFQGIKYLVTVAEHSMWAALIISSSMIGTSSIETSSRRISCWPTKTSRSKLPISAWRKSLARSLSLRRCKSPAPGPGMRAVGWLIRIQMWHSEL